jgi:hypothetical protein
VLDLFFFYFEFSNLEKEFGASTCVENPKKNGVIRIGPYFANKICRRALGKGGSDMIYGFYRFKRIVKKNYVRKICVFSHSVSIKSRTNER